MEKDVLCVGTAITDIPLYPVDENVLKEVSYPVDDISLKIGGDALNESVVLAKLGKNVSLFSAVGNDPAGDFIKKTADKNNVDTTHLQIDPNLTTSMNVGLIRPDGQRTFITNRNGSLWKMNESNIDIDQIKDAKILSMASIFNNPLIDSSVILKIFKKAKKENMVICADIDAPRLGETIDDIKEILPYIDYFFPNDSEAKDLTQKENINDQADLLMKLGVKNVIIKVGSKGCFIKNSHLCKLIPSFVVPTGIHVDTTGAGDNFAAGFISKLVENKSFEDCAIFGNAVASISVRKLGATAGVTSSEQVQNMIDNYNK